jgi:steroid 5-alpha reductase family enzyme
MLTTLLIGLALSLGINIILFLVAFARKTDKLTDAAYGLTFIVLVLWAAHRAHGLCTYNSLIVAMIVLWAARLGGFLVLRVLKAGRDKRFDDRRENFWKFGSFWLAQAVTVWLIMLAASQALVRGGRFNIWAVVGLVVWVVGFASETVADSQKFSFRNNPQNKGRWIHNGLWRYSRHPNYFGEIVIWIGIYIYALSALNFGEAIVGLLSPLTIAVLLLFVSGIPPLEKSADQRWGKLKDYQDYKARTSLLVPLPPK